MEFQLRKLSSHAHECQLIEIKTGAPRGRVRVVGSRIPRGLAHHRPYKTYLVSVHGWSKQAGFIELGLGC